MIRSPLRPVLRPVLRSVLATRFSGILDRVPGAAAAYSLELFTRSFANAPVVRVRRDSDDAEQNFTAAEVSGGALVAFCGAGNGFVTTWYDQSGNTRNLQQAVSTSQPQIVIAGALVTKNGKPSILPDGTNDFLTNINAYWNTFISSDFSTYAVMEKTTGLDQLAWAIGARTGDNANWLIGGDSTIGNYQYRGRRAATSFTGIASSTMGLFSSLDISGGGARIDGAGGADGVANRTIVSDRFVLFDRREGSSAPFSGAISAAIFYPSDQSANNAAIESALAEIYGITLAP